MAYSDQVPEIRPSDEEAVGRRGWSFGIHHLVRNTAVSKDGFPIAHAFIDSSARSGIEDGTAPGTGRGRLEQLDAVVEEASLNKPRHLRKEHAMVHEVHGTLAIPPWAIPPPVGRVAFQTRSRYV